MVVLGIDPGSRYTGYGVIAIDGSDERLIAFGVLRLNAQKSHLSRLKYIYDGIIQIIDRHLPDECAIEMPVYGRNPQSMLKLGRAQAAAMLAVLNREIPVTEYTPKEVKKAVTGNGNAAKEQVWFMMKSIFNIDEEEQQLDLDAADALAVGLCHAHRSARGSSQKYSSWASYLRSNPGRIV